MNSDIYIPQTAYLKNAVRSIWQIEGAPGFQTETILPKGNVELIFNFTDDPPIQASVNDNKFQLAKCFINGFNTNPIQLQLPEQHSFLGIQFHAVAIKKLFGIPASEFANKVVDMILIDPSLNALWHQLASIRTFDERIRIIKGWLQNKLIEFQPREVFLNNFFKAELEQNLSVTELAKTLCYSTRQLSRKMYEFTNLNTEDVLLYKKYLRSVDLLQHSNLSLTEIAYESHFADQSHFIKSFRSFTDLTPTIYRQNKSPLQGHLFEHVR